LGPRKVNGDGLLQTGPGANGARVNAAVTGGDATTTLILVLARTRVC
jgi:hypothetical protein